MKISAEKLQEIIESHGKWLNNKPDGKQANLCYAELQGAYLQNVDLRYANLECANLQGANLRGANLQYTNLWRAH